MKEAIEVVADGIVLVEYGPMRMMIHAFEHGKPRADLAQEGARQAIKVLENLARFLPLIKKKAHQIELRGRLPDVVRRMVVATQKMGEPDLTPLAAVAGATSDVVADSMIQLGGTKIIVDNGGDIAIRLREGEVARVGVKTEINAKDPAYVVAIDATMRIGGVATSGLGGRSFTKGIASAVTVLSESASLSDAAATVIGNFTNVDDPAITRTLPERIYPETDIAGEWVTLGVGNLSREKVEEALNNGLSKADSLCRKGLVKGVLIVLKDRVVFTDFLRSRLITL
jgi:ApbE superfamily uncharacterized protein (UPF0280 family)